MFDLLYQFVLLQINPRKALKYGKKAARAGISVWFIVLVIALLLATIGFAMGFYQSIKEKNHKKTAILVHLIGFGIAIGCFGLIGLQGISNAGFSFWLLAGGMFLLGSLHAWFIYLLHEWSDRKGFWPEAFFTGYVGCLGALLFILVYYFTNKSGFGMTFGLTLLSFPLPFLFLKSYDQFMAFPQRAYKGWKYPNRRPSVLASQLQDPMLIHLIISEENANNAFPRKVLVKVSPDFVFGSFFHAWVHERNHQSGLGTILYLNRGPQDEPISWIFYIKPRYWWQFRRYIHPGETFQKNGIRQTDTIVALRIKGDTIFARDISASATHVRNVSDSDSQASSPIPSVSPTTRRERKAPQNTGGGIKIKKRN